MSKEEIIAIVTQNKTKLDEIVNEIAELEYEEVERNKLY